MGVLDPAHGVAVAGTEIAPGAAQPPAHPVFDGEPVEHGDRRLTLQRASFSGPLPSPTTLAEYDEVVPGLAREIIDQWKAEIAHRHATVTSMRQADQGPDGAGPRTLDDEDAIEQAAAARASQ